MPAYADTSFSVRASTPHPGWLRALTWLQHACEPLPFTRLHHHELRRASLVEVAGLKLKP